MLIVLFIIAASIVGFVVYSIPADNQQYREFEKRDAERQQKRAQKPSKAEKIAELRKQREELRKTYGKGKREELRKQAELRNRK